MSVDDAARNLEKIRATMQAAANSLNKPMEAVCAENSRLQALVDASSRIGMRFAELEALSAAARQRTATLLGIASKVPPEPMLDIKAVRSPEVVWLEAVVEATNANTEVSEAQTRVLHAQERRLNGLNDALQAILGEQRTTTRLAWATLAVALLAAILALIGLVANG